MKSKNFGFDKRKNLKVKKFTPKCGMYKKSDC